MIQKQTLTVQRMFPPLSAALDSSSGVFFFLCLCDLVSSRDLITPLLKKVHVYLDKCNSTQNVEGIQTTAVIYPGIKMVLKCPGPFYTD